jgi:hypothetical protein
VRAGALSDEEVGKYVGAHFVSAWRKVGTFQVVQVNGKAAIRQGGNIAVYFCTPDLEVVNVIAGPVNRDTFLREAKWAVETFAAAMASSKGYREPLVAAIEEAHEQRVEEGPTCGLRARAIKARLPKHAGRTPSFSTLRGALAEYSTAVELRDTAVQWSGCDFDGTQTQVIYGATTTNLVWNGNATVVQGYDAVRVLAVLTLGGRNMHEYLAERGFPKLDSLCKDVFENVLGEVVSDQPVSVTTMDDMFDRTERCHALVKYVQAIEARGK